MTRIVAIVLTVLAASASAKTNSDLTLAFERSDSVALERAAIASSAAQLIEMLDSDNRRSILAAIIAAPHASDAPLVLTALARAAHSADRSIALAAVRAGLAIVSKHDRTKMSDLDVPRFALGDALKRWHALARDSDRWADVRVVALEIARTLADILAGKPAAPVVELLSDPDPEVRAAAFELLPSPLPSAHAMRVAQAVSKEPDPFVSLAAAVSLCGGIAFGDDVDVGELLDAQALARLESLVLDTKLPAPRRVDAALCFRKVSGTDVIARLAKTVPSALKARVKALAAGAK